MKKAVFLSLLFLCCNDDKKITADENCLEQLEICDGIDNNCNNLIDETCDCPLDLVDYSCWPENTIPIESVLKNPELGIGSKLNGQCEYGRRICEASENGGTKWGLCTHAILPFSEVCDNVDNDCNGQIDESLKKSCWTGPRNEFNQPREWIKFNSVDNPNSICKTGIQICQNGHWTQCLHEVLPQFEICDGIDNNCDGVIDNGTPQQNLTCGLDVGDCQLGIMRCDSTAKDTICQGAIGPQTENCDNRDNDCDGEIDEDLYRPCQTQCGTGVEVCAVGNWMRCSAVEPQDEICDGLDNDCDGRIDEDLNCSCARDLIGGFLPCQEEPLTCGQGFKTCLCTNANCTETAFSECLSFCAIEELITQRNLEECDRLSAIPINETCNNWDDNCNNLIDENLIRLCYTGPEESNNVGECSSGQEICHLGRWGNFNNLRFLQNVCDGQITPQNENCDNKDNDCDGEVDEEIDHHEKVDMVFILDRSGSMCVYVDALKQGITPYIEEFAETQHRFAIVNVPGDGPDGTPPSIFMDFAAARIFLERLNEWRCEQQIGTEPQYDAVEDVATNALNLAFRADAFPMMIVMTDEFAQTLRPQGLNVNRLREFLSPCRVGNCGPDNIFELYAIIPRNFRNQWCAPARLAIQCYDLFMGITGREINQYLDEIFSEICR